MSATEIHLERSLKDYPDIVTLPKMIKIVQQIKNCIFRIHIKDGSNGTGFFCFIIDQNKNRVPVMITCEHVIGREYLKNSKAIKISFNNEEKSTEIKLDSSRNIYISEQYDITIIEIKKEDNINPNSFLEIDEKIYQDNPVELFAKKSVYIIQYPRYLNASVSYGIINSINEKNIMKHYCITNEGSSGSPIMDLENNKVIGVHRAGIDKKNFNIGIFLKTPINEFFMKNKKSINIVGSYPKTSVNPFYKNKLSSSMFPLSSPTNMDSTNNFSTINYEYIDDDEIAKKNEITIEMKIEKGDINKPKYFLDNTHDFEKPYDHLKELNQNNTELFINNKRFPFQKFFIPDTEGNYKIKLSFKNYIKDCSYMFYYCTSIRKINFKYFKTSEVTNMSNMFCYCNKLKSLDLSSFDTKQVTDMSHMFSNCADLRGIILTSFDVRKVIDMQEMFSHCNKLEKLDISSFVVSPYLKTKSIFEVCRNLSDLKLNKKSIEPFRNEIKGGIKVVYI